MRERRLDPKTSDYIFGRGSAAFLQDTPETVAQSVRTRLALWRGTWFLDTSEGVPWLQSVLGNSSVYESVIRDQILGTPGVTGLKSLQFVLDVVSRRLDVSAEIETAYGDATI